MAAIDEPFDQACFVDSEYNQFDFVGKRASITSDKNTILFNTDNKIYLSSKNTNSRGLRLLKKGYDSRYLLMVVSRDQNYEAFRVYGPKVNGKHSISKGANSSKSIRGQINKYTSNCTDDQRSIAVCQDIGRGCVMTFEKSNKVQL